MSGERCIPVLALALFWAAVSAVSMGESVSHDRRARAWLWGASFFGALMVAAYCFGRLLVWEAA